MTPVVVFSVALIKYGGDDPTHPRFTYVATCDRCGEELPEVALPITIVNFKGDLPPAQFEAFKRRWNEAVAQSPSRPIIMNADVEVLKIEPSVGEMLEQHFQKCPKLNRSTPATVGEIPADLPQEPPSEVKP